MKKKNKLKNIFMLILIIYSALYISKSLGYYEFIGSRNNWLTEKEIKEFEQDIKEGNNVVKKNYKEEKEIYQNNWSKLGSSLSKQISDFFNNGLKNIFNFLKKLFHD